MHYAAFMHQWGLTSKNEDSKKSDENGEKIFNGTVLDDNYIDDLRIDDERTLQDELNEDENKTEKKPGIFSQILNKLKQLFDKRVGGERDGEYAGLDFGHLRDL